MKLIIQIPCYNEAATLPLTLEDLPRHIDGVDRVEILVIDDGSTDDTAAAARASGVDHLIRLKSHRGLAAAFRAGLDACVRLGADIIVNTDGDHSFNGSDIPRLIAPILDGRADLVIGARPVGTAHPFSWSKRILQRIGSWVVSRLAGIQIVDPTCGFRAYSREAALRLNIISSYTYVLESIIQASSKGLAIAQVPITANAPLRESRLIKSTADYILRSMLTLFRIYVMYAPLRFFTRLAGLVLMGGLILGGKYVYDVLIQGEEGNVSWLIGAVALGLLGFQIGVLGLLSDLIAGSRKLAEESLYRLKAAEVNRDAEPAVKRAAR